MSQQNVVIDRPLIRPRPCAYLGKNYVLYDNWADNIYTNRVGCAANGFRYQDWSVISGTWNATSGYLEKTSLLAGDEDIGTPCTRAHGTWEVDFKLGNIANNHQARPKPIWIDALNYYEVRFNNDGNVFMMRWIAGGSVQLIAAAWVPDTNVHTIKLTRDSANRFDLYLDDVNLGNAVDATFTTSVSCVLGAYITATAIRFDDLKVY